MSPKKGSNTGPSCLGIGGTEPIPLSGRSRSTRVDRHGPLPGAIAFRASGYARRLEFPRQVDKVAIELEMQRRLAGGLPGELT
jgi:hypothetical protein